MTGHASVMTRATLVRPFRAEDEPAVRQCFQECHPEDPPRAPGWYTAYPTLVAFEGDELIGFTSFSVSPSPMGCVLLYGNDLCVRAPWRQQGWGQTLANARVALGRTVGARGFIGVTDPDNRAMARIFERQGFHRCQSLPRYFTHTDGVLWTGGLPG